MYNHMQNQPKRQASHLLISYIFDEQSFLAVSNDKHHPLLSKQSSPRSFSKEPNELLLLRQK